MLGNNLQRNVGAVVQIVTLEELLLLFAIWQFDLNPPTHQFFKRHFRFSFLFEFKRKSQKPIEPASIFNQFC